LPFAPFLAGEQASQRCKEGSVSGCLAAIPADPAPVTLVSAPDHPWRRRQSRGPWSKPAPAPSRILPSLRFRSPLCDFARLSHDVIRSRSPPFTLVSTENVWHFNCSTTRNAQVPPARPEDANEPSHIRR